MSYSDITANAGFRLIDFASDPYHEDEWFNWRLLDGMLNLSASAVPFVVATGTGAAYIADYPIDQALAVGLTIAFTTPLANTGAVTLAVDGQAAKPIKVNGSDPASGSFPAGMLLRVVYDGTNFNVVYPAFSIAGSRRITVGASGVTVDPLADDFIIENSADVGVSLLSPNGSVGRWFFGSVAKPDGGGVVYDHAANRLYLRANQYNGPYIDADKVVRQPDRPFVNAYITYAATAAPANGTVIIFNTESFDTINNYNNATGVFTAPIAGTYEFIVDNECTGSVAGATQTMAFYKNGVQITPTFQVTTTTGGYYGHPHRAFITLAATDTVDFRMVTLVATNLTGRLVLTVKLTS